MAPTPAVLAYQQVAPGVTLYSGYPLAEIKGTTVTFAGVSGTHTPVVVGVSELLNVAGNPVDMEACGTVLCFQAEGDSTYRLRP